jgi:hypothetical protein
VLLNDMGCYTFGIASEYLLLNAGHHWHVKCFLYNCTATPLDLNCITVLHVDKINLPFPLRIPTRRSGPSGTSSAKGYVLSKKKNMTLHPGPISRLEEIGI